MEMCKSFVLKYFLIVLVFIVYDIMFFCLKVGLIVERVVLLLKISVMLYYFQNIFKGNLISVYKYVERELCQICFEMCRLKIR